MNPDIIFSLLIVIGALLIVAFAALYVGLVLKPKERRDLESWKIDNKSIIESENEIRTILKEVGKHIPPCSKCYGPHSQLWKVDENLVIIRCISCLKKQEYTEAESNWITLLNLRLRGLYILIETHTVTKNDLLKKFIVSKLKADYLSLRKGSLYCRVFKFELLGVNEDIISKTDSSRSRRISQKTKDDVWRRDEGKCVRCNSRVNLEFDHIIPFSKGGSNTYRNIELLCENCNRQKYNNL